MDARGSIEFRTFKAHLVPQVEPALVLGPAAFSRPGPYDLEIGCGVGMHPILYSQNHPERNLIALEHTKEKFDKFQRRLEHHGARQNLTALHANGISWVTHFCPTESIEKIFLMYPNPDFKNPARRWFLMPFFSQLLRVLKSQGEIKMVTNILSYRNEALDRAINYWGLKLHESREFKGLENFRPRTHFESKYLKRGDTCYELCFTKD